MSSEKSVSQSLSKTQRHLFMRFVLVLALCLVVVQITIAVMLVYGSHRNDVKLLSSMQAEYQRIITFNDDDKFLHVITSNPQRLEENQIAIFWQPENQQEAKRIGGFNLESPLAPLDTFLANERSWIAQITSTPFISLPMQANTGTYWMVQPTLVHFPTVLSEWTRIGMALALLAVICAGFVWKLIHLTLAPLFTLANQLDEASTASLDTLYIAFNVSAGNQSGQLSAMSQSINKLLTRLSMVIESMENTLHAIAHDLRTPLSRIRLSAESTLISVKPKTETEEALKSALADCLESSEIASQMLTTLMKINDEAAGRSLPTFHHIDVKRTLEKVAEWYEEAAEEKSVTLSVECKQGQQLVSDESKLIQVLVNLIDNAIKFTPEGGNVVLAYGKDDESTRITVSDTGMGIAEEHQSLIFSRLFRTEQSRSTEGYGLGLSLAKAITTTIQGDLSVSSELGKGSIFTLSFPQKRAA
ncbi:Alkaline phosphatase synthesis sensor protein PhoR [Grimontia celer]|uniref:histidine kinase n=1 Tax=Grimontia celer TaxID=1796497 RepID=A0A128F7F9_9GAMM|nr:HAMP domain-containing sensor histidine kinase [Grimontia celer]CZF82420.1 Alkaline phosphatase synthesis sensor protein PhoR [Grimontia celer]